MSDPHPDCPICRPTGPLAAPRHVAAWADLAAAEQFILLARLGEATAAGAAGFTVAADHGHFHLRPGGAQALRITTRKADRLLPLIANGIDAVGGVGHESGRARHILFRKFRPLSTKNPATHYNY